MEVTIKAILNESDLIAAEARIEELIDAEPGTKEDFELELLSYLVAKYERTLHPLREQNPIETIKFRMEQMGLSKADLAKQAFNGHRGRVGEIISGKRKLTLPMIRKLSEVLRVDPKYLIADYGN